MVTGAMMSLMLPFMTTFSAPTRGFAIVVMVTLFIVSVIMPVVIYFTEVISVFLNISPVMMISLIYGSIVQIMTVWNFKMMWFIGFAFLYTAVGPLFAFMGSTVLSLFPALSIIPLRAMTSFWMSHLFYINALSFLFSFSWLLKTWMCT